MATGDFNGDGRADVVTANQASNNVSVLLAAAPVTLQSITVTPANSTISTGATQQFTATGVYSDSSAQDITATVSWSSSNTAVATIDAAGLATAVGDGQTTITATQGSISGSTTLTVSSPALVISKTAAVAAINAGDSAVFTISVTNNGTGTAFGATVTDQLPTIPGVTWNPACPVDASNTLVCQLGNLPPGAAATLTVSAQTGAGTCVSATPAASSVTISNTAYAGANNSSQVQSQTAEVTVSCPILILNKTPDAGNITAGQQAGYTITIANTSSAPANNVRVKDALPTGSGLSWSASPSVGSCSIAQPNTLICLLGNLSPGQSPNIHLISPTDLSTCGSASSTTLSNMATAEGDNAVGVQSTTATIKLTCVVSTTTTLTSSATRPSSTKVSCSPSPSPPLLEPGYQPGP